MVNQMSTVAGGNVLLTHSAYMHEPPVDSPQAAVRTAIVAERRTTR